MAFAVDARWEFSCDLEVDYKSEEKANIIYSSLAVDKELQPDKVRRVMSVVDGKLSVHFEAVEARFLRASYSAFVDVLTLATKTIEQFSEGLELQHQNAYQQLGYNLLTPITKERLTAEIIELIASVLDENLPNQQQMLNLSGFSVLGFLLQSVPSHQLNMETLSALKHMLNVISNCGLAEVLVKDAISHIFLNPFIWVYAGCKVQRELYMFLIQQFDNDPRLLRSLCRFPRILDIIQQFYWDNMTSHSNAGGKPLLPITNKDFGERPNEEEIQKIRLLLLSIGEMSLREHIAVSDIESLVFFLEISQDMACIEDVLHMIIRALSQKSLLASFLDQVNLVGGCHLFINLLQRNYEPVRLLGLQLLGRLLVAVPSEKKGSNFFTLAIGRSKSHLEDPRRQGDHVNTREALHLELVL